jgi:hypothetical protein
MTRGHDILYLRVGIVIVVVLGMWLIRHDQDARFQAGCVTMKPVQSNEIGPTWRRPNSAIGLVVK